MRHFEPLLGWECAYVCHNVSTEKKTFTVNSQNVKQAIGIQVTFISENKFQKDHFLTKYDCLYGDFCVV